MTIRAIDKEISARENGVKLPHFDGTIDDRQASKKDCNSERKEPKKTKMRKKKSEKNLSSSQQRKKKSEGSRAGKKSDHRKIETDLNSVKDGHDGGTDIELQSSHFWTDKRSSTEDDSKMKRKKSKRRKSKEKRSKRKEFLEQASQTTLLTGEENEECTDTWPQSLQMLQQLTGHEIEVEAAKKYDDDAEQEKLVENAYTLIFTAPWNSSAFWMAITVFIFQQIILWVLLSDLFNFIKISDPIGGNAFHVPAGVPYQVTFAQGLAMLLTIAIQDRLILATAKLVEGKPKLVIEDDSSEQNSAVKGTSLSLSVQVSERLLIQSKSPFSKWVLSYFLQFLTGFMLLIVIFLLTMQAETVKDVCLNFAALVFISEIDEIAFKLALYGFVTNHIQDQCKLVQKCTIEESSQAKRNRNKIYRVIFFIIFAVLFSAFGYLVRQQWMGSFLCQTLYLQFGDMMNPRAAFYSGFFYQQAGLIGDRAYYVGEKGSSQIAYCSRDKVWTMVIPPNDGNTTEALRITEDMDRICNVYSPETGGYVAKSGETQTFDVTTLDVTAWTVMNLHEKTHYGISLQFVPLDMLTFRCNECDETCGDGECIEKSVSVARDFATGRTTSKVCKCNNGRYGINCEFPPPCKELASDRRLEPFEIPAMENGDNIILNTTFVASNVTVTYRPLYYSIEGYIILFLGRRWALSNIFYLFDDPVVHECLRQSDQIDVILQCSKDYLENVFHARNSNYEVYYMSEPMDYLTESDYVSPNDLRWFRTPKLKAWEWDRDEGPGLLCTDCMTPNFTNSCHNFGLCQEEEIGVCDCPIGFAGSLCELRENCLDHNVECYNGGICGKRTGECECSKNFYGSLCQFKRKEEKESVFLGGL